MALITWDQKFSVGNAELDHQHKQLFHLINILHESTAGDTKIVETTLMKLVDYLENHFKEEERFMGEIQYPGLEVHHREHGDFMVKMLTLVKSFKENGPFLKDEIHAFLKDWIEVHILNNDAQYARYASVVTSY